MNQDDDEYTVKIVKEWDEESLLTLFRAGGWWREEWDPAHIADLVQASFAFAVAIHVADSVTAGMGRLISDGTSDAYIQDLVILPEYRGRGIGAGIVRALVDHCMSNNITWIALVAEPGTEDFYGTLGFSRMSGYVPMLFTGGSS
ncbi:MAG: GNAT family N-acetyltransferase [Methanoregulaceae archaeon]|jgi:ribosomal protein S18 acetylase RimI-like enzyme|nr:GNAT family N-acetyltransferase [Methanoregulaceae archaeon]MDD5685824.1 GNAT family N-acetyltransferase [Methanoregulaceae archaeon]HRX33144.1 GNAT family N-acetyltransferase [Methanoregulaceae archaeon]